MCKRLKDFSLYDKIQIATTYATTAMCTQFFLAEKYNTTSSVIGEILKDCISQKLVSEKIAIHIAQRAIDNSALYHGDKRTKKCYGTLLKVYYGINLDESVSLSVSQRPLTSQEIDRIFEEVYLDTLKEQLQMEEYLRDIRVHWHDFSISDETDPYSSDDYLPHKYA